MILAWLLTFVNVTFTVALMFYFYFYVYFYSLLWCTYVLLCCNRCSVNPVMMMMMMMGVSAETTWEQWSNRPMPLTSHVTSQRQPKHIV